MKKENAWICEDPLYFTSDYWRIKSMENKNKFTAIYSTCVQIGTETWQQKYSTKVFDNGNSIQDVLDWAKSIDHYSNITISDIIFAAYYE